MFVSIAVKKENDGGFGSYWGENIDRVVLKLRPGITRSATFKYCLDIEMIFATVLGGKVRFGGEEI